MRNVGNTGEDFFGSLCSLTGITANPAKRDERGWDYSLEFPIEFSKSADLAPSPIHCRVQVKSTDDKKRTSVRITIKNLLHFVKLPEPAFFCFMKYNGEDLPQDIFLMHVGDEIIRKTLHTARKLHSAGNVKFNKEKLTIKFRKEHRIGPISGSALKEAIEQYIPNGMEQYVKDKIDKINNIGYENGHAKATFNVNEKNPANAILDCSLGITDKINVSNFTAFDQRFAVSSKDPFINSESGRMFFDPKPTGKAQIIFSKEKFSKGIIFNANWYSSSFNVLVSKEEQRFRIANSYIELIFYPLKERIDFTLLKNYKGENLKLSELNKLSQLQKLATDRKDLHFSVSMSFDNKLLCNKEDLPKLEGPISLNKGFLEDSTIYECISKAHMIFQHYNLHDELLVSLNQISHDKNSIMIFYGSAIDHDKRWYKITFTEGIEGLDISELDASKKVAAVACISTRIGEYIFFCIFGIIADRLETNESGHLELKSQKTGYHKHLMFPLNTKLDAKISDEEFNKVMLQIKNDGIIPIRV